MRVHLVANVYRPDAMEAASNTAQWLSERGHTVAVEPETGKQVALDVVTGEAFGAADLVIAFGGDGTLIRAAHLSSETGAPILGVYYGRFGFVTQCKSHELLACLSDIIDGKMEIESRMMLEASLMRQGTAVATIYALNETVLQRSVSARMMTFEVRVDGRVLTTYPADGVLVSTPTGSTAYNLSAGGPILDPNVQALILTALAPHTLTARTLVLRPDSEIHIKVESEDGDSVLSADGQTRLHILPGDFVRVRRSSRVTNLVSVEKHDFLIKLGQRLQWGQSLLGEVL